MKNIYFDNSATTRVDDRVVVKMTDIMQNHYGNPSSLHYVGAQAYNELGQARHPVAKVISAHTDQIYFTSGGTEANNIAIQGAMKRRKGRIITTALEHSSVRNTCKMLEGQGYEVITVDSDPESHRFLAKRLLDHVDPNTALVSFMHVNNETGEILPVKEMIQGIREKNPDIMIHCDCVQSFGKYPFKVFEYDADAVSMSAHKLHGPKGVGALYLKDRSRILPLLQGGMQEGGIKPGTENLQSICGFGVAADQALCRMNENLEHMRELKGCLLSEISKYECIHLNSPEASVPYIVNFSILGKKADESVNFFGLHGIQISAGAACSKGTKSHVLQAMHFADDRIESAVRISFCKDNTLEEVQYFAKVLQKWIEKDI